MSKQEIAKGKMVVREYKNSDAIYLDGVCIADIAIKKHSHQLAMRYNNFDALLDVCKKAIETMENGAIQAVGDWRTGMFCGLEDRDIRDRYEACLYGYEKAIARVQEWIIDGIEQAIADAESEPETEKFNASVGYPRVGGSFPKKNV